MLVLYPVQVPLKLQDIQDNQTATVNYRADSASAVIPGTETSGTSLKILLDQTPSVPFFTSPHQTNQSSLQYLVMANDNLSGTWRYLVQNADSNNSYIQPPKDLVDWIEFPQPRISDADPQSFWNNTLPYNSEMN